MEKQSIRRGAIVRNSKGTKLGTVVTTGDETFIIATGNYDKPEYSVRYSDIDAMLGDDIVLDKELERLRQRNENEIGRSHARYSQSPLLLVPTKRRGAKR